MIQRGRWLERLFIVTDTIPGSDDDLIMRGGSAIISPMGKVLAGPLYDQEGILFAELDLGAIARSKFDFDVVGHYARPDVFNFAVNKKRY